MRSCWSLGQAETATRRPNQWRRFVNASRLCGGGRATRARLLTSGSSAWRDNKKSAAALNELPGPLFHWTKAHCAAARLAEQSWWLAVPSLCGASARRAILAGQRSEVWPARCGAKRGGGIEIQSGGRARGSGANPTELILASCVGGGGLLAAGLAEMAKW